MLLREDPVARAGPHHCEQLARGVVHVGRRRARAAARPALDAHLQARVARHGGQDLPDEVVVDAAWRLLRHEDELSHQFRSWAVGRRAAPRHSVSRRHPPRPPGPGRGWRGPRSRQRRGRSSRRGPARPVLEPDDELACHAACLLRPGRGPRDLDWRSTRGRARDATGASRGSDRNSIVRRTANSGPVPGGRGARAEWARPTCRLGEIRGLNGPGSGRTRASVRELGPPARSSRRHRTR